ncbi:protein FAM98A-like [Panicum virgatum]|uniref:protein FAM98A-like n=1 Tax=Panicum virgatum TaxID=38727 RepID=UPI0019D5A02F|nr:protein FAM98A-like [Panicum virgatum]
MAPANDAAADTAVPAKAASADADAAALPARRDDAVVPSPWRDAPRAADACVPILGVAELWPELSRSVAAAKGKKAPAASSSTAAAAPNPMAALREQGATNKQIHGAPTGRHSDRTVVPTAAAEPEQPPMHASSHRISRNAGVRGHHHQSGRFVPHHHGRGGQGFHGGRGSRRPAGSATGRGNAHANGSSTYLNRGGGRHGQGHRGGFNRQPHGRGHEDRHTPLGHPEGYVEAPHHMHPPPLMLPFMPMVSGFTVII